MESTTHPQEIQRNSESFSEQKMPVCELIALLNKLFQALLSFKLCLSCQLSSLNCCIANTWGYCVHGQEEISSIQKSLHQRLDH